MQTLAMVALFIGVVLLWAALVLGITLIVAFPFEWAWDVAIPPVFHLPEITYWQSFGLCLLLMLVAGAFKKGTNK